MATFLAVACAQPHAEIEDPEINQLHSSPPSVSSVSGEGKGTHPGLPPPLSTLPVLPQSTGGLPDSRMSRVVDADADGGLLTQAGCISFLHSS